MTHVVLSNDELGKISKEQRTAGLDVWHTSLVNPEFAEMATLCGALGILVTDPNHLDDALAEAMAHPGPSLVNVLTDPLLV